jgi:hypothetical protein
LYATPTPVARAKATIEHKPSFCTGNQGRVFNKKANISDRPGRSDPSDPVVRVFRESFEWSIAFVANSTPVARTKAKWRFW